MSRSILLYFLFFLSILLVATSAAAAQTAVNYRFLEVVDTQGAPVEGATIETRGSRQKTEQTDQQGRLPKGLAVLRGDFNTTGFTVSKSGYYPYEDIGVISGRYSDESERPLRLELLRKTGPADQLNKRDAAEQLKREFFLAAKNGDLPAVQQLLKTGLAPNMTTAQLKGIPFFEDVPVINFAAMSGNYDVVKTLLDAGANIRTSSDVLSLYLSADGFGRYTNADERRVFRLRYETGIRELIEAGADVNKKDFYDRTSLMLVALNAPSNRDILRLLIKKGVSPDAIDRGGNTALNYAVSSLGSLETKLETIKTLLKSGANPNIVSMPSGDYYCVSALIAAVSDKNSVDVIRTLVASGANVNLACKNGETALTYAIKYRSPVSAAELIRAGADVKGEQGTRALAEARKCSTYSKDCKELVELLKSSGASESPEPL